MTPNREDEGQQEIENTVTKSTQWKWLTFSKAVEYIHLPTIWNNDNENVEDEN